MAWDKVGYAPCIFCLNFALGNQKQAFWLPGAFSSLCLPRLGTTSQGLVLLMWRIRRIVSVPNVLKFIKI